MNTYILAAVNLLVFFAFFNAVSSLTCLKCEESSCRNERSLMCRGGTTTDPCGCCTVCAKLEGEKCGGPWNIGGVCDRGLLCKPKSDFRTGICRNPNVAKRLPKCSSPTRYHRFRKTGFWSRRRHSRCRNVQTIFCNRSCRRCCTHQTTCNPNMLEYIPKTRCQKQRRLYAPKHLFTKDQQDENDFELESLENDIKG